MRASLQLIKELGPQAIEERVMSLAALIREGLANLGAEPYEPQAECLPSQIVLARLPGHDASEVSKQLLARGVIVSARKGGLRVSGHFYNDEGDVERLVETVRAVL
jgi:selenocysteine lyase/cysteine desulfurase